jgi:hypothetical protein
MPQTPSQPSGPQAFPSQSGVHASGISTHSPFLLQVRPPVQDPQVPPQPLSPHTFPSHFGLQLEVTQAF